MKLKNIIYLFLLISSVMSAQLSKITSETIEATDEIILDGVSYTSFSSAGGQVFIEDYAGDNFGVQLQAAITAMPDEGGIINCRGKEGLQTMTSVITINKPVRILLGRMVLSFASTGHMFNIQSDGVEIIGLGRSPKEVNENSGTVLKMTGTNGYHIYNSGSSCLTIRDMDMKGNKGTVGGIYMDGGTDTLSRITLDGLFINKTKMHGIYIKSPEMCSINCVRISEAGGHGVYMDGGTSCNFNTTYVASADLAGFVLDGLSYSTLLGCASENCGIGYLVFESNSISLISTGCEELKDLLSGTTYSPSYTSVASIEGSDMKGHGYLIVGGSGISLISPYCKDPADVGEARSIKVAGDNTNSVISHPQLKNSSEDNIYDIEITATPATSATPATTVKDLEILWNPMTMNTINDDLDFFTKTSCVVTSGTTRTPILDEGDNTYIRGGSTVFSD